MNEETKREIDQLKNRVLELEQWKDARKLNQITYPLDAQSIEAIGKYFMRIIDSFAYFGGAGTNQFQTYIGQQDNQIFEVYHTFIRYTADPSTDIITLISPIPITDVFGDDDTVILFTDDTMPGGLSGQGLTTYYVVSAAADGYSFKLSATLGGAAINITSAGVGHQLLERI